MKNKPFGLDIGTSAMKVVWLSGGEDKFMLRSVAAFPTPQKGMMSESPLDQEEMAQSIRKVVDDAKITTQYVNIALPESQVYTRIIEMPILSDKELSSAIYWEAEQYIPLPLPTITLDWKILKRPDGKESGTKMDVLLVGAPTVLIDRYQKVLSMAGFIINVMETEILSAIRSLSVKENFPTTLIVHIGSTATSLAIVKNGMLVFTYVVSAGGLAISRAIAADFGFSLSQADEYKKAYGLSGKMLEGKIGKVATSILTPIVTEVKKALSLYEEKYKSDNPVLQILLSGGSAKLPGLDLFFAESCGIESVIANPWHVLASQELPKDILDNAPGYTIAVGLGMRDYE